MRLTVLIPAHNEEAALPATVRALNATLTDAHIAHEILVVDDHCTDQTARVLQELAAELSQVRSIVNPGPPGYGYALRMGLEAFDGDAVCFVMADGSDDPRDVVKYWRKLEEGFECAFGSRFISGARVENYPLPKLVINRLANLFIRVLFGLRYNDVTNAFKCFRREVIDGIGPILACHFNLTVELPLKAIVRGYSYAVVPTNWYGRVHGVSKLKIQEMGSRYMFVVLYVLLEKWLARGDYKRKVSVQAGLAPPPEAKETLTDTGAVRSPGGTK